MINLTTKPTRQQLTDPSFWESVPQDGMAYDSLEYIPMYSVLSNGNLIELTDTNNTKVFNSFPFKTAAIKAERLSKEYDNVTLAVTGYLQGF